MHYEFLFRNNVSGESTPLFHINRFVCDESLVWSFDHVLFVFASLSLLCILIVFPNGILNHSHVITALMRALLTDSIGAHIAYVIDINDRTSLFLAFTDEKEQPLENGSKQKEYHSEINIRNESILLIDLQSTYNANY